MTVDLLATALPLLTCCAILRFFDRDILLALGQEDEQALARLFASDLVQPASALAGAFQLREETRTTLLARLREESPGDELVLHERALAYFLDRMSLPTTTEQRLLYEDCCFHHLDSVRLPLTERREWQQLRQHIDDVRAVRPQRARHLHRISLYDGLIAIQTQDYAAGEATLHALLEQAGVEDEVRMRALNVLAHSHWYQTHYDRARDLYQQVHDLASVMDNRLFQGFALINMSLIDHEIGYYERALKLSLGSLQLFRAVGDAYHEAHALYEIAKNAMQLGRWQDAQHHFNEAARIYERLDVQAQLANLYSLQALLYHALGDLQKSEALYLRSLEIGQSPEHGDISVTMDTYLFLGLLYQTDQRYTQAAAAYQSAITLAQQLHNQHSLALALFRQGDVFKARGSIDAAIDSYRESIDLIERLRGNTKSEDVKLGLLGATQQVYEAMVSLLLAQKRNAEAYHYVERARSRAFLDLLADKSPDLYSSLDQPVATLPEVQAHLPTDALLIEYYTTGVLPHGERLIHKLKETNPSLFDHMMLAPRIVIFAVTRDHFEVREARLDPNLFRPQPNEIRPGRRWLQDRKLRALYDQLIGPIRDLFAGQNQIFLIPHGPLHHVPFLALRAPDGRYLLDQDGPTIALAPSATVLIRNCLSRPPVTEDAFLALGYNDTLVALRHAESEARAVARMMHGAAWTGPMPKTESLIALTAAFRGLHIASHAVYQPDDPLASYLLIGTDDRLSARAVMRDLKLHADLVSLSACTSGLSQVVPGDELLGLLRAWLYAGATTVVCALWEAADIIARLMMEHFYQALSVGTSPGIAFRDALVAVRQMTGRSLAETFARWRQEDEVFTQPGMLPEISPDQFDTHPYSDPMDWAPFMLIGRA